MNRDILAYRLAKAFHNQDRAQFDAIYAESDHWYMTRDAMWNAGRAPLDHVHVEKLLHA